MSDTIYLVVETATGTVQLCTHVRKDANQLVKTINRTSGMTIDCAVLVEIDEGMIRDALARLAKHNKAVESQKEEA
jgi:hypothetical protein